MQERANEYVEDFEINFHVSLNTRAKFRTQHRLKNEFFHNTKVSLKISLSSL